MINFVVRSFARRGNRAPITSLKAAIRFMVSAAQEPSRIHPESGAWEPLQCGESIVAT
jgi:hypothetical protein